MRSAWSLCAAAALCAVALAGCSAAATPEAEGPGAVSSGRFIGPWADLFQQSYGEATSDDERAALEDSDVSAQEYAFFQDRIIQCLAGLGVSGQFRSDGSLDYSKPRAVSPDAIQRCNADNGIRIIALRDAITRNPTHLDESKIMLDCLQRTGAVGSGYTRADLENGVDIDELGSTAEFAGCAADPLNYRGD